MATRLCEIEEKKHHHNIAIAAVLNTVFGCLYSVANCTSQLSWSKRHRLLTYEF